jgi:hypothetical protein
MLTTGDFQRIKIRQFPTDQCLDLQGRFRALMLVAICYNCPDYLICNISESKFRKLSILTKAFFFFFALFTEIALHA